MGSSGNTGVSTVLRTNFRSLAFTARPHPTSSTGGGSSVQLGGAGTVFQPMAIVS